MSASMRETLIPLTPRLFNVRHGGNGVPEEAVLAEFEMINVTLPREKTIAGNRILMAFLEWKIMVSVLIERLVGQRVRCSVP